MRIPSSQLPTPGGRFSKPEYRWYITGVDVNEDLLWKWRIWVKENRSIYREAMKEMMKRYIEDIETEKSLTSTPFIFFGYWTYESRSLGFAY